jgi:sugar lactone lactonase YvrE
MQNNLNPDGSPKDITRDSGAIYRVGADGQAIRLTPREFGITNTMAWTADGHFLTADTLRNEIDAYDLRMREKWKPQFGLRRQWRLATSETLRLGGREVCGGK